MSILNAIVLGLIQGIAEFLPVSSSGHLSVITNLFDMVSTEDGHMLYDVLLHLATLISLCVVYWTEITDMFREAISAFGGYGGSRRKRYPSARMLFMIVIATLPLIIIIPVKSMIDGLYNQNIFIGVMLILTGGMLYTADRMTPGNKTEKNMTVLDALLIGLCQCVATIPGLSRTGTTITAGISTGLKRDFAVKFSFLLSIPAVLGAGIISLVDAFQTGVDWASVPAYLIGMAVAMVTGIGAISLLKYIASKGKFGGFAYYCWIAGAVSIILTMIF